MVACPHRARDGRGLGVRRAPGPVEEWIAMDRRTDSTKYTFKTAGTGIAPIVNDSDSVFFSRKGV